MLEIGLATADTEASNVPPANVRLPVPSGLELSFAICNVPLVTVIGAVALVLVPAIDTMPLVVFAFNAPAPDKPLNKVVVVFVTAKLLPPLPNEPLLLNVMFCAPLMVAALPLPTTKLPLILLLPKVEPPEIMDCNAPPFKSSSPTPNAFVALFACKMPAVNVVLPV